MKFMQYYLGKWIFNFVFLIGVAVLNLPNVLTISRIVVIPVIFLSIYIHSVPVSYTHLTLPTTSRV